MDSKRADLIVKELFMDMKADLKSQKEIGMAFHVFFDDGYWRFEPEILSKEQAYGLLNIFLTDPDTKTIAYSVTSDCNMRSPVTGEIIGEQLMAALVSPDGKVDVNMQPYKRLPNGKIQYEKSMLADGISFGGDATALYQPVIGVPEEIKKQLVKVVAAQAAQNKVPYKSYTKEDDGPTAH